MPRNVRIKSSTGIHHIVLRGINKQTIFKDDEDNRCFLSRLEKYQQISQYEIYAYCLMNNHIHLLMKEGNERIGDSFRRIGASFVYWYNWKYNRVGHLFQDRYLSEAVEKDNYFLTVLRYIHHNPLKAGLIKDLKDYPWSSYREYLTKPLLCNTSYVLKFFSEKKLKAQELLIQFHSGETDDQCLDYDSNIRLNDLEAAELIRQLADLGMADLKTISTFSKQNRNALIKEFKEKGLSIRQIERLTGVSFSVIRSI